MCHIETLGERIRKLRKQKNLTLEALAGDQLTKGMLSLIENGKANPSMESLNYIAQQLDVDTTELLEEVSSTELRSLLEQVEALYKVDHMILTDEVKQIITLIEPFKDMLPLSYESARLLDIYSHCLFHEKVDTWGKYYNLSIEMYENLNLVNQRAKMMTFYALTKFTEHDYAEALRIIQEERKRIDQQKIILDAMTRLDFDYYEAILCFAVGDTDQATKVMKEAITFSKENRIFYLTDDLYRLTAFHAMMVGNYEDYKYFRTKLEQYAAFADHKMSKISIVLLDAHFNTTYTLNYEKAYEILENQFSDGELETYGGFFYVEKGKAFYGLGKYEEALTWLEKYELSPYLHHPYDLSLLYTVDTYIALCYKELGETDKAVNHAKIAVDHIGDMPHTPYKDFINETYEEIKKELSLHSD